MFIDEKIRLPECTASVPFVIRTYVSLLFFQIKNQKKRGKNMALFIELLLMGVGLAMDAFAVSVCKGLSMKKLNKKQAVVIGLYFGGFQALMPFIGWILGSQFQQYITSIDHWIAFILLGFIGGKMVIEAVKEWNEEDIGITTMIISIIGVVVGNFFGGKYKHKAELVGGVILILLGLKILIEHLSGMA